ncbi:unnamed protein product [Cylindrotheca closterium]|uniref:MIF4G domain-containing protein n=1 Tax=Cylindrotheca closterium TaxID=2856 RepID=A0AAD2FQ59_9STRA|nr:unnamed protein product [Cylindrotheca closterium]
MSNESGGGGGGGSNGGGGRGRGKGRGSRNRGGGRGKGGRGQGSKGGRGGNNTASTNNEEDGQKKNNNKGRNNRNRRNNKAKSKESAPQISEEEKQRLAEEKRLAEEAEAERKRIEAEQQALEAAREARRKALEELETKTRQATEDVQSTIDTIVGHRENREALEKETLMAFRKDFAAGKKSLKSDLKKCTAFVKKIKSGSAWSMKPADINRDVSTLNLSRYVEEVVSALLEADLKLKDMPVILALCKAMHLRYPEFLSNLWSKLWSVVQGKPTEETAKSRRIYVRIITEFVLNAISTETKPLVKLITECSGGKDGSYAVSDATVILAFAKTAGLELLGVVPRSLQESMALIQQEVDKQEAHAATIESNGEEVKEEEQPIIISTKMATNAKAKVESLQGMLEERAVSDEISELLCTHCKGAYRTLSDTLVTTHTKLQKMEKRCENDRLLSGSLPEAREKGLNDARKLKENLVKTVEALSDIMALKMPQLKEEESEETDGSGPGVELWTKEGGDGDDFGPFDDEETRAFYCDIPDLLTTIPPALLNLSPEEIEKRKADNQAKYGGFDSLTEEEGDTDAPEVVASEAELNAAEEEENKESTEAQQETEEDKETPHYKLTVLLEQELPECCRREQIDEMTERFCTNHGSSKTSRKRLSQTLFHVPRTRLDLLPYYSRMTATLGRVWSELGTTLVTDLEQQFHGQAKYKKNQNIESRLRTARYIGELTKFRVAPPMVALRCLRRCLDDFTGGNVDVSCCILESCGRYLFRLKHTNKKLANLMEIMMRLSKAKHHDERLQALINTAFYTVKPPASGPKKQMKTYPPLEGYLRHLLMNKLQPSESSISNVSKQLIRFPWGDPSQQCGKLICKIMLKTCRRGRYRSIQAVASVATKLRRHKPEVCIRLLDAVFEELQWSMENPSFKDQQRTLTIARLLGEMYCASIASGQLVLQQLYKFINFGHEIPDPLREASESIAQSQADTETEDKLPVFNSASAISQTIQEDEEVEEIELETKEEVEAPKPVAVSKHSKFDPRVFSSLDPPNSVFRIKLVCTLLEVVSKTIVTRNNLSKVEGYLAAFQRYLFTKTILPTEVEFALLDTFDLIDSQWRRVGKEAGGKSKQDDKDTSKVTRFPRYPTWLDAHNATVANEEADAAAELRVQSRLEASAETRASDDGTVASDMLHDDDDMSHDDDDDSIEDGLSHANDSLADEIDLENDSGDEQMDEDDDDEDSSGESEDDEDSDDEDSDDDSMDDDDSEEEFDEQAYMQQLEDEAFERELRRLTMDALEKGKATTRGGKVAETMPTGSQFIKKKQADLAVPGPAIALGGKEGIKFQMLKKGNKGKMEAKQFYVPTDTNLAHVATKQDDEAARERDMIKARVLQYEADAAESANAGGNVYLEQEKLQVIRNRPLSMDDIDRNFGTSGGNLRQDGKSRGSSTGGGRGSSGGRTFTGGRYPSGRSGGRGGRGRGHSGRSLV